MLLKSSFFIIETMRRNNASISPELLQTKKKKKYSSMFVFLCDTMLVTYVSKIDKCVIIESTLHSDKEADTSESKKYKQYLIIMLLMVLKTPYIKWFRVIEENLLGSQSYFQMFLMFKFLMTTSYSWQQVITWIKNHKEDDKYLLKL